MKRTITTIIEDGTQATVEATACSNEGGNVFEPAQDQRHYYVMSLSIEEMQEAAKEYEESPEGQRFTKSIENAVEFTFKHCKGGLCATQLNYLANKHYNNLINGSFDLMALAYRRGYMNGKATAKNEIKARVDSDKQKN